MANTHRLVRTLQENMSSHHFRSILTARPLQRRTNSTSPSASAAEETDTSGRTNLIPGCATGSATFSQENSLPPVLAAPSDLSVQEARAAPWAEAAHTLEQVLTGRRRLSFATNLAQPCEEAPEREPPFAERSSAGGQNDELPQHTSLQSTDGARAPCCLWVCGRGGVAPEGSDGSEGSRTSNTSQVSNIVARADLMPAIAKALRRSRRRRNGTFWKHARSWQWWSSVTDVYTGKVTRLRRGHAFHPLCPLALAWNTYLNVIAAALIIILPLIAGFHINKPLMHVFHRGAAVMFVIDVLFSFVRGYKIGTTSDLIELRLARCAQCMQPAATSSPRAPVAHLRSACLSTNCRRS